MARISGIYANGFGEPVAGVSILLTARATSSGVVMTTMASQKTGSDGSYGFDLRAGVYVVTANGLYLGVITVSTGGPDGTLNDYLAAYNPAALTPAVVETVQGLVKEAQAAAIAAAEFVRHPVIEVPASKYIPVNPSGFYLVKDDEDKGGGPQFYYFSSDKKYWIAMVEDTQ